MALGMVRIEKAFRGCPLDNLRQFPSQVHCILHADVEALTSDRVMHVCGITGNQHTAFAVGGCLSAHVGEPGDPAGVVHTEVRSPGGDKAPPEVIKGRLLGFPAVPLADHHSNPPAVLEPGQRLSPVSSWRMPHFGSSLISTSAISELTDGSQPGKSMPALLRIRLRPPSQPTR